jgi:hypothetical protein
MTAARVAITINSGDTSYGGDEKAGGGKEYPEGDKHKRKTIFTRHNRPEQFAISESFENLFQQYLQMEAILLQVAKY